MIKIITAKAFSAALDVDNTGKILSAPKILHQSIGWNINQLMESLRKNKFQSIQIEDVEEV